MDADTFHQRRIEAGERLVFVDRQRPVFGQGRPAPALDDPPPADDHGLARQDPVDAGKDRLATGGELHLEQFVARRLQQPRRHQPGVNQRSRLGGKGEAVGGLGVIERLDAERVARQHQPAGARIVQR